MQSLCGGGSIYFVSLMEEASFESIKQIHFRISNGLYICLLCGFFFLLLITFFLILLLTKELNKIFDKYLFSMRVVILNIKNSI